MASTANFEPPVMEKSLVFTVQNLSVVMFEVPVLGIPF